MKLVIATRSPHKLSEIREILSTVPQLEVLGLDDVGLPPGPEEAELEPYETFLENAASKARHFHLRTGLPTVADDSGLVVDALDGAPGVRSKRFSPRSDLEGAERDRANNRYLLERLRGVPQERRTARFVCEAVLLDQKGRRLSFRGEAPGVILERERGSGGFGYDPLFYDPQVEETFADLSSTQKNARSHRGQAFRALADYLRSRVGDSTNGSSPTPGRQR